jgi:Zn finger protein HypA/HybF involved in hydrogenase expression
MSIYISTGFKLHKVEESEVRSNIIETNSILDEYINLIKNHNDGDNILICNRTEWSEHGKITIYRSNSATHQQQISDMNRLYPTLEEIKHNNIIMLHAINNNQLHVGLSFAASKLKYQLAEFILSTVADGCECNKCGGIVTKDFIDKHQASWGCAVASNKRTAEAMDYERISNLELAKAVRRALTVPSMLVSEMYAVYAPKWVLSAAETYYKDGGYAGMTLEEFLTKVAVPDIINADKK